MSVWWILYFPHADISATAFYKAQPVMDFALEYLNIRGDAPRRLFDQDRLKVCTMIQLYLHPLSFFTVPKYNGWSWSCFVLFWFVAKESPQGSPSCGNASTWYIHSLQNYWDNLSSAKWIDVFLTSFLNLLIVFFSCIAFHLLYHAILLHNFVRLLQIWPRWDKGISCPLL